MSTSFTSKMVQTVLGPVHPEDLGVTLTHEHLSMDFSALYSPPPAKESHMADCPFTLENSGWIRRFPFSHKNNLNLGDDIAHQAVIEEMKLFKENGGKTIVENTTTGLNRNLEFLKQVALQTGVNVVAGAGFYVASAQTPDIQQYSVENIAQIIRTEMTEGINGIKCGVIGEIASIYPIQPFEKRVLEASAIVQQELECPVITHPHRVAEAPQEVVRVYQEAGGKVSKMVVSHLDRTLFTLEELCEFAKLGTFLEFDMFGIECSHYQLHAATDMLSDAQRIQLLKGLVREGFEDRIVIAHDIYAKHRLMKFGGHGYSHILLNVVPKMLQRGISQKTIDKFLIHNPRSWLAD